MWKKTTSYINSLAFRHWAGVTLMSGGLQNFTEVYSRHNWDDYSVVQYLHLPIQLSKRLGQGSKQTVADEPRSGSGRVAKFLWK